MKLDLTYKRNIDRGIIPAIMVWVIPLSCILLQYYAKISTYGLLLLMVMAFFIAFRNKSFYFDKDFLLLGMLIGIQQILCAQYFQFDIVKTINVIVTIWLIIIASSTSWIVNNKELLYRNFSIIGFIATFAIYIQFFMCNFLNMKVSAIMIFPQAEQYIGNWVENYTRPSGFFSEPQVHCTYMLPLIIIALEQKKYKYAIFLSVGVALTGSSLGIMMVASIWMYTLFSSSVTKMKKIGLVILIAIGILAFLVLEPLESARIKLFTVFTDFSKYSSAQIVNSYSYSNYLRLIKGWVTYIEMPLNAKLLGIGITNFLEYLKKSNVSFSWNVIWSSNATMAAYFSSAAGVFIECGLIVGIAYYLFLYRKMKQGNVIGKKIILALFIQSFLTQTFFNGIFIFYILMYYASRTDKKHCIKLKV